MMFFKMEEKYWSEVKTFFIFLNLLPPNMQITTTVNEIDVPLDMTIAQILRKI